MRLWLFRQAPVSGTGLGCSKHHGVYSHPWWTTSNELRLWKPLSYPALVTLETLGMPTQSGGPEVGLARDQSSGRLSHSTYLGDPLSPGVPGGLGYLDLPRGPPSGGWNSAPAYLELDLQEAVMPSTCL